MVRVHPEQRNYLCFLWFNNEAELLKTDTYRMTSTAFGVKGSHHNTIAVIRGHAENYEVSHPDSSLKIRTDQYMGDVLTKAGTSGAAIYNVLT